MSKCSFSTCMENRRLAVRNNKEFTCKHLKTAFDSGSVSGYDQTKFCSESISL